MPNARLFSLGGPTETTIWSIWHEINEQDQEIIPYGKALESYNETIANNESSSDIYEKHREVLEKIGCKAIEKLQEICEKISKIEAHINKEK